MLTNEIIVEELASNFGADITEFEEHFGMLTCTVSKNSLKEVVLFLKDNSRLHFNFLTDITGIQNPDFPDKEFCSVYHLHSFTNGVRIRLKVYVTREDIQIPSLTDIFAAANWMERETFDFYGIEYAGHPNLKRILNLEDMDYHPMRKEYPLEDATREDKIDALFGR